MPAETDPPDDRTAVELALSRFLEGEPEPGDAALLVGAMTTDPAFAGEVRRLLALDDLLRQAHEPDATAFAASLQARLDAEEDGNAFTQSLLGHLRDPGGSPPGAARPHTPRLRFGHGRLLAAAAVVLAILGGWWLAHPRHTGPGDGEKGSPPAFVAVVVKLDGAEWEPGAGGPPSEGSPLPTGPLRLRAGRVTLTLFNGVMLSLQGPADLDMTSVERIFCRQGKLRARVPPGAEGFAVLAPGAAVVDLGTELGLNVAADGKAEVMVFEGMAEVSVLNEEGHTLRSQLLRQKTAAEVDPDAGRIRDIPAAADRFVAAPELIPPALVLGPGYTDAVRQSQPWGYWRFEALANGLIPNEVPGRPALRVVGPVELAGAAGENHSCVFGPSPAEQYLLLDGSWTPPRQNGYAVELWVLPEEFHASTLVALTARADEQAQNHAFLLELTGRSHHLLHEPCRVRYLDRWPPGPSGGINVFSRRMYIPYRWHHLVAQKVANRLELYLNGELTGTAGADPDEATGPCRLVVGRLKTGPQRGPFQVRPFVGRLDELAVHDGPLSAEDIRRHYELGTAGRR
jgi:hypothetical protein